MAGRALGLRLAATVAETADSAPTEGNCITNVIVGPDDSTPKLVPRQNWDRDPGSTFHVDPGAWNQGLDHNFGSPLQRVCAVPGNIALPPKVAIINHHSRDRGQRALRNRAVTW